MRTSSVLLLVLAGAPGILGATGCGSVPASGDGGALDARELDAAAEDASVDGGARPDGLLGTAPVHALQPLDVGTTWTWQMEVSPLAFLPGCQDGDTFEQSILRAKDAAGRAGAFLEVLCGEPGQGSLLSYGADSVDQLVGVDWGVFLSGPLVDGRHWTTGTSLDYFWESVPGTNTGIGSFVDCWKVVVFDLSTGGRTEATHCPSVGPVLIEAYSGDAVVVRARIIAFTRPAD